MQSDMMQPASAPSLMDGAGLKMTNSCVIVWLPKTCSSRNRKVVKIKHNMQEYKTYNKIDCPHIPTSIHQEHC